VQALREAAEVRLPAVRARGILDEPHVAAPRRDGEPSVGHRLEPAHLEHDPFGRRDGGHAVVLGLLRGDRAFLRPLRQPDVAPKWRSATLHATVRRLEPMRASEE
jgi:hypothetical protein